MTTSPTMTTSKTMIVEEIADSQQIEVNHNFILKQTASN